MTAVCRRVVELSGFGRWFPTVQPSCYNELFSYSLDVELPAGWGLVTPGISLDGALRRRHRDWLRPIEDIFVCAAPHFEVGEEEAAHFGPMLPGRGGVAVVSPRSPKGEEWGYERGDLRVAGDAFVNELVGHNLPFEHWFARGGFAPLWRET